jgi:hypothetical protein
MEHQDIKKRKIPYIEQEPITRKIPYIEQEPITRKIPCIEQEPITNLIQRARVDYKGKIPTKYWIQNFNKRVFRKKMLIQKFTAGDIVQWNMINKRCSPREEYPTRPAKADLRWKAVPDPPSR